LDPRVSYTDHFHFPSFVAMVILYPEWFRSGGPVRSVYYTVPLLLTSGICKQNKNKMADFIVKTVVKTAT